MNYCLFNVCDRRQRFQPLVLKKKQEVVHKYHNYLSLHSCCCRYSICELDRKMIPLAVGSVFEKKNGNLSSKYRMYERIGKYQM